MRAHWQIYRFSGAQLLDICAKFLHTELSVHDSHWLNFSCILCLDIRQVLKVRVQCQFLTFLVQQTEYQHSCISFNIRWQWYKLRLNHPVGVYYIFTLTLLSVCRNIHITYIYHVKMQIYIMNFMIYLHV